MDAGYRLRGRCCGRGAVVALTPEQYFRAYEGHAEITPEIHENAVELLGKVNVLLEECVGNGWVPHVNPATDSLISGTQNGGWRPQACPIGAPSSSHKQGRGVDVADADNSLDAMVDDDMLKRHGLFREHPSATRHWCHLTDRAPGSWTADSDKRTFFP